MVTTSSARTVSKSRRFPLSNRADAAEPPPRNPPTEALTMVRGIAAQLPASFARLIFENAEAHAGLADRDSVGLNGFDFVHAHQVEHDAAMKRDGLAVVTGSSTANGDRKILRVAVAQHILDFFGGERLYDHFGHFAVEQLAEHG